MLNARIKEAFAVEIKHIKFTWTSLIVCQFTFTTCFSSKNKKSCLIPLMTSLSIFPHQSNERVTDEMLLYHILLMLQSKRNQVWELVVDFTHSSDQNRFKVRIGKCVTWHRSICKSISPQNIQFLSIRETNSVKKVFKKKRQESDSRKSLELNFSDMKKVKLYTLLILSFIKYKGK